MKCRFLLMLILLMGTLVSWGQNYETIFGIDSTEWEIPFCNLDQGVLIHQVAIEDTLINGMDYKKVGTKQGATIDYGVNTALWPTNGYLREDTTTGKVWFLGALDLGFSTDTIEYLVADFSLGIGDTFRIYNSNYGDSTIIVDTIYYQAGRKHIEFNYTKPYGAQPTGSKLTFIEGVGTNWGWVYMHNDYNLCRCLHSYIKDGGQVYYNSACVVIGSIRSTESKGLKTAIYPQPIIGTSVFEFENSEGLLYELHLYGITGKIIARYQTTDGSILLSSDLYTGICFYQLYMEQRKVAQGKLLFGH